MKDIKKIFVGNLLKIFLNKNSVDKRKKIIIKCQKKKCQKKNAKKKIIKLYTIFYNKIPYDTSKFHLIH